MTYGQRALIRILQRTHGCDVAARCGRNKSRVTRWVAGEPPGRRARVRLHQCYGIPLDAWGGYVPRRGGRW